MIEDKLAALAAEGRPGPTNLTVTIWPSKTTAGYVDTEDNFTVDELLYAVECVRKAKR